MTTIGITGATGQLGRLTVQSLLARGVEPSTVVAIARRASKADELAAMGVVIREGDYDVPATMAAALIGVDKLLLVSTNEQGTRVRQHRNVIEAAMDAGVKLVAYTSILHADTTRMLLAKDHRATEILLEAAGIPYVFLRNAWYSENYTAQLRAVLAQGALTGASGDGKASVASRRDYAEAAAAVLSSPGHENKAYELGGEPSMTAAEIAEVISTVTGHEIPYLDVRVGEFEEIMAGAGLPGDVAKIYADAEEATRRGDLETDSGELRWLIGHPTTPFEQTVREAAAHL